MKKLAIIAILAATMGAATATEIGLRASRNTSAGLNGTGITLNKSFGQFGVEASADRTVVDAGSLTRFGVLGTMDVAKVGGVTLTAKAGAAYIDPSVGKAGYTGVVGLGASYPVAKNVSLVADYSFQQGQARVSGFNGNNLSVGVKYAF